MRRPRRPTPGRPRPGTCWSRPWRRRGPSGTINSCTRPRPVSRISACPPSLGAPGSGGEPRGGQGPPPPEPSPSPPAVGRPTPLDPYPEPRPEVKGGDEKSYPPELGTDAIAILEGRTFMFSDSLGDIPGGSIGGLLHDDTRFLSTWVLTLNREPLSLLKSRVVDYYSAAFFLTNPDLRDIRANTL